MILSARISIVLLLFSSTLAAQDISEVNEASFNFSQTYFGEYNGKLFKVVVNGSNEFNIQSFDKNLRLLKSVNTRIVSDRGRCTKMVLGDRIVFFYDSVSKENGSMQVIGLQYNEELELIKRDSDLGGFVRNNTNNYVVSEDNSYTAFLGKYYGQYLYCVIDNRTFQPVIRDTFKLYVDETELSFKRISQVFNNGVYCDFFRILKSSKTWQKGTDWEKTMVFYYNPVNKKAKYFELSIDKCSISALNRVSSDSSDKSIFVEGFFSRNDLRVLNKPPLSGNFLKIHPGSAKGVFRFTLDMNTADVHSLLVDSFPVSFINSLDKDAIATLDPGYKSKELVGFNKVYAKQVIDLPGGASLLMMEEYIESRLVQYTSSTLVQSPFKGMSGLPSQVTADRIKFSTETDMTQPKFKRIIFMKIDNQGKIVWVNRILKEQKGYFANVCSYSYVLSGNKFHLLYADLPSNIDKQIATPGTDQFKEYLVYSDSEGQVVDAAIDVSTGTMTFKYLLNENERGTYKLLVPQSYGLKSGEYHASFYDAHGKKVKTRRIYF